MRWWYWGLGLEELSYWGTEKSGLDASFNKVLETKQNFKGIGIYRLKRNGRGISGLDNFRKQRLRKWLGRG
jgi:hypothetical protein